MFSTTDRSKKTLLLTAVLLVLLEFALFAPSIGFDFIHYDDYALIINRPYLYNEDSFLAGAQAILFTCLPREGPMLLRDLTWALDSYLFGFENPAGYHFGNVVLNSLNVGLVFIFLTFLGWPYRYALGIAVVFSILPFHVEAVSWIMGRKDVLVTFFMLLGLINHVAYLEATNREKRRLHYLLELLVLLLALFSKISALTFFMVLAALEIFYPYLRNTCSPGEAISFRRTVQTIIPKFAPHVIISILVYFWYTNAGNPVEVTGTGGPLLFDHVKNLVLFTPLVFLSYLKIMFVPLGLSAFYEWPSAHQPLTPFQVVLSVVTGAALCGAYVVTLLRHKPLFFYLACFAFVMIPYSNIVPFGVWMANRYAYFAGFFILAALATAFRALPFRPTKHIVTIFGCALCLAYIFQTLTYQQVWRDDLSLWRYETSLKNPSLMALSCMADFFVTKADEEADGGKKAALLDQAESYVNRGFHRIQSSSLKETTPHLFRLYYLKGTLAAMRGETYERQLSYFRKAYDLRPTKEQIVRKMAEIYYRIALQDKDPKNTLRLASTSLSFFETYLSLTTYRPTDTDANIQLLNQYKTAFPFLSDAVTELETRYFSESSF